MIEPTFRDLMTKSKVILDRISIDKAISELAGDPMPHETGAMGNIMPKKKGKLKLMPKNIEEERPLGPNKIVRQMAALKKLDSAAGIETNAGFGHEERVFDKDGKVIKEGKNISDKDESLYVPEDIINEKGLVHKASYENIAEGGSWTDETSPIDDSFYLPAKIKNESNDTDKKAKKKKKEADKAQREYFGKVPDNPSDQGRARVKQNYNVGTIENAQIGGQGGANGIGKSKERHS